MKFFKIDKNCLKHPETLKFLSFLLEGVLELFKVAGNCLNYRNMNAYQSNSVYDVFIDYVTTLGVKRSWASQKVAQNYLKSYRNLF